MLPMHLSCVPKSGFKFADGQRDGNYLAPVTWFPVQNKTLFFLAPCLILPELGNYYFFSLVCQYSYLHKFNKITFSL